MAFCQSGKGLRRGPGPLGATWRCCCCVLRQGCRAVTPLTSVFSAATSMHPPPSSVSREMRGPFLLPSPPSFPPRWSLAAVGLLRQPGRVPPPTLLLLCPQLGVKALTYNDLIQAQKEISAHNQQLREQSEQLQKDNRELRSQSLQLVRTRRAAGWVEGSAAELPFGRWAQRPVTDGPATEELTSSVSSPFPRPWPACGAGYLGSCETPEALLSRPRQAFLDPGRRLCSCLGPWSWVQAWWPYHPGVPHMYHWTSRSLAAQCPLPGHRALPCLPLWAGDAVYHRLCESPSAPHWHPGSAAGMQGSPAPCPESSAPGLLAVGVLLGWACCQDSMSLCLQLRARCEELKLDWSSLSLENLRKEKQALRSQISEKQRHCLELQVGSGAGWVAGPRDPVFHPREVLWQSVSHHVSVLSVPAGRTLVPWPLGTSLLPPFGWPWLQGPSQTSGFLGTSS